MTRFISLHIQEMRNIFFRLAVRVYSFHLHAFATLFSLGMEYLVVRFRAAAS